MQFSKKYAIIKWKTRHCLPLTTAATSSAANLSARATVMKYFDFVKLWSESVARNLWPLVGREWPDVSDTVSVRDDFLYSGDLSTRRAYFQSQWMNKRMIEWMNDLKTRFCIRLLADHMLRISAALLYM